MKTALRNLIETELLLKMYIFLINQCAYMKTTVNAMLQESISDGNCGPLQAIVFLFNEVFQSCFIVANILPSENVP